MRARSGAGSNLTARGFAPFALALLFQPCADCRFSPAGWSTTWRRASRLVHEILLPVALAWQVLWAIVVLRNLMARRALVGWPGGDHRRGDDRSGAGFRHAAAVESPFILYAGLVHAPRHLMDYALRNSPSGRPASCPDAGGACNSAADGSRRRHDCCAGISGLRPR